MFDINLDQKKISSEINKKITQKKGKIFYVSSSRAKEWQWFSEWFLGSEPNYPNLAKQVIFLKIF